MFKKINFVFDWLNSQINKSYSFSLSMLIFLLCLCLFLFDYNSFHLLFEQPFGIHIWRQTDCLSMVYNYQQGESLFEPQILNLLNGSNKGVGEFPLVYYFLAKLFSLTGNEIFVYRLVWFIISLIGLVYLFKLVQLFIKSFWWTLLFVLLFYSSPVYVIYSISFITDPIALSFTWIALYHFMQDYFEKGVKHRYYALFFFILATLSKFSFIIYPMILLSVIFFMNLKWTLFLNYIKKYYAFILLFLVNFTWVYIAKKYNAAHENEYFSTRTWPIWDLSREQIKNIFFIINHVWFHLFLNKLLIYIFIPSGVLLSLYIWIKSKNKFLKLVLIFLFLAIISYVLLWFLAFESHDYYFIVLLPFLFFLIGLCVYQVTTIKNNVIQVLLFFVFGIMSITASKHCKKVIKERTGNTYMNGANSFTKIVGFDKTLEKLHIPKTALFFSVPDESPNASLYHIKRRGITDFYNITKDSVRIQKFIQQGIRYVVVNNVPDFDKQILYQYTDKKIYSKNQVEIYTISKERILTK